MCDGPKKIFPMISHVLGVSKLECLNYLCIGNVGCFLEVVQELVVYLVV